MRIPGRGAGTGTGTDKHGLSLMCCAAVLADTRLTRPAALHPMPVQISTGTDTAFFARPVLPANMHALIDAHRWNPLLPAEHRH